MTVVATPVPLQAMQVTDPSPVTYPDGTREIAQAGQWVVSRGKQVLAVLPPARFAELYQVVDAGALTLSSADCAAIDETTGLGSTRTPEALRAAIDRLARIEIGTVKIAFTPGQLEEIAYRAKKRGQTVGQALQAVIDRIREELFWRS